ncbi:MAG TPA: inositol monophosphatase family protein [Candidatus Limnocylindria bacterium]|nr:inositol monophosphatase family protein [Candidatus Limnocylindria bacterium]
MSGWQDELDFSVEVARRAGELLKASYGRVERIDRKSKRDVVTEVDFASEQLVLDAIRETHPGDEILAEESGHHERHGPQATPTGRTWVIDPLDGTVNYANAIPYFCVSVALVDGDRPAVGVVFDPMRGDCYAATADGQAVLNEVRIHASDKDQLGDFVVSLAVIGRGGIGRERRISREIRIPRRMGSAALSLAYVASGRFDAFVQNGGLSVWDVAAAGLIAERAGATVSNLEGGNWWDASRRSSTVSIVAAPQPHHGDLLSLLASVGTRVRTRR